MIRLDARKLEWLRAEVLEALKGGRWTIHAKLVKRVQKRWRWATETEVVSVIDQLWDEGRIDCRRIDIDAGAGSTYATIPQTQWKILPVPK